MYMYDYFLFLLFFFPVLYALPFVRLAVTRSFVACLPLSQLSCPLPLVLCSANEVSLHSHLPFAPSCYSCSMLPNSNIAARFLGDSEFLDKISRPTKTGSLHSA